MEIKFEARILNEDEEVVAKVSAADLKGLEEELYKLEKVEDEFRSPSRETSADKV